MSVTAILDRVSPYCKNWSRSGSGLSLLKLIEEAQDYIVNSAPEFMIWRDSSNQGWPPYLNTTQGVYQYSITGAVLTTAVPGQITKTINGTVYQVRCKRVRKIFQDVTNQAYDYTRRFRGVPYVYYNYNPYSMATNRLFVVDYPFTMEEALENDPCVIRFEEDPGQWSGIYFCEFEYEAPRLSAESVDLVIPSKFEDAIEDYVMGKVADLATGVKSQRTQYFFNTQIERFRKDFLQNVKKYEDTQTAIRRC